MAMISELFFIHCDNDWDDRDQEAKLAAKSDRLRHITFTDFGTRRRRSFATQEAVVAYFKKHNAYFMGTSNVHLAHKYNVRPIGTMAHEWIMGISALEGLRHANRYAMKIWSDIYKGELGTALTDTFGTDVFWADFDVALAKLFDGPRHDSGCPFGFTDKTVANYKRLRIDPTTKTAIFSDGLDTDLAVRIDDYCKGKIRSSFGIGTHFTNDFTKPNGDVSKPLNMVVKLAKCDGVPVVKLSDTPTKAIGDRDALRVAKWTFFGQALDAVGTSN
jgi:nicotinate phosphoribosyltransferase